MDIITAYDKIDAIKDVKKGVDMLLSELSTFRLNGLTVDESRDFISAVTRLSPSPDWFTGFNAFNAQQDGFWFSHFVIETIALDAGTSTGSTYTDVPMPEFPSPQFIQPISNGVFSTLPVARWTCVLTTLPFDPQEFVSPEQTFVIPAPITEVTPVTMTTAPSVAPSKSPASLLTTAQSDAPSDVPSEVPSDMPSDAPSSGLLDDSSSITEGGLSGPLGAPPSMVAAGNGADIVELYSGVPKAWRRFGIWSVALLLLV